MRVRDLRERNSAVTTILARTPRLLQGPRVGADLGTRIHLPADGRIVTIPNILHQVWIGPHPVPLRWTDTWRETNRDFEYRLWNDDAIQAFGLRNHETYQRFFLEGLYDGAADVSRDPLRVLARYIEVLSRIGPPRPIWRVSGPGALTDVLADTRTDDVTILPWWTFFAAPLWGDEESGRDPYAQHFWSTTAERWGHERPTPYPDAPR